MTPVTSGHWPYPRWVAHRGAGKLAPENTLASFRLGAAHGYRMFECDVKLSADEVPFLMHDATLSRTTDVAQRLGSGASAVGGDHPWSALAQLDAGGWHSRAYAGEPLPTLANIAHYCLANGLLLNIEIKPTPGLERRTGEVVAQHAAQLWAGAEVPPLLTSFEPEALAGARDTRPELPRGLLLDTLWTGWLETALALGLRGRGLQPRPVGHIQRSASQECRISHPELHRQRRMGGAAPAGPGHRCHHHRPGRPVRAGLTCALCYHLFSFVRFSLVIERMYAMKFQLKQLGLALTAGALLLAGARPGRRSQGAQHLQLV